MTSRGVFFFYSQVFASKETSESVVKDDLLRLSGRGSDRRRGGVRGALPRGPGGVQPFPRIGVSSSPCFRRRGLARSSSSSSRRGREKGARRRDSGPLVDRGGEAAAASVVAPPLRPRSGTDSLPTLPRQRRRRRQGTSASSAPPPARLALCPGRFFFFFFFWLSVPLALWSSAPPFPNASTAALFSASVGSPAALRRASAASGPSSASESEQEGDGERRGPAPPSSCVPWSLARRRSPPSSPSSPSSSPSSSSTCSFAFAAAFSFAVLKKEKETRPRLFASHSPANPKK